MLAIASALLLAQTAAAQPTLPPPQPCASEGHGQFDFFVGEWDVYPAAAPERMVARSKWERLYNGCALRENWMPLSGRGNGGSLNDYDAATCRWHQRWIGSADGHVDFDGGFADGKMVLTGWWPGSGPKGEDGLTRMTYSRLQDGAVRQLGQFSADHGLNWVTSFDFIYRPHKGE